MLSVRQLFTLAITSCAVLAVRSATFAQTVASPAVRQEITQNGSAHVIVEVNVRGLAPEGLLDVAQAEAQLTTIRQTVDQVLAASPGNLTIGHRYEHIPFFSARVDAVGLSALESSRVVVSISEDALELASLSESVPLINAPAAWSAGATGAGWKIAVLDTGVQTNHPFLAGKTYAEGCFSNQSGMGTGLSLCPSGAGSSTAPGSGVNCATAGCNHGTHVAGIAVGAGGTYSGVAPGAQLIAIQVFTRFNDSNTCGVSTPCVLSYVSDQVAALDYVLSLAGPGNINQIAAANLSLGGGQYTSQAACDAASGNPARRAAIDNLRSIGVATVAASGNNGYVNALNAPACISSAVSVGSTTKADAIVGSSNRAPFLSMLAPGSAITSSVPTNGFAVLSGTSMASPHIAGAWAVIKQAKPTASVADVLTALRNTGVSITDEATQAVYPRINVDAARQSLVGPSLPGKPTITSVVQHGATLAVTWTAALGGSPLVHRLDFFSGGGAPLTTVAAGASNTHSLSLPAGVQGTFGVSVTASNAAGFSPSSSIVHFTIDVGAPGQPTVTTAVESVGALTVAWTSGAGAAPTAHRLDFFQGASSAGNLLTDGTTSVTVALPPELQGTFAVQVSAFNGAMAGAASAPFSFAVGPPCTAPGSPNVSGDTIGGVATVRWSAVTGATAYIISAGTAPGGVEFLASTNIGLTTTVSTSGLPAGFQAWVRVSAVNACGQQSPPGDYLLR